jgi:hypothetical protein
METLRCQDPWGREIVLLDAHWYGKILIDHPELADALDAVEQTLTDPELVNYDKAYENREVYYRRTSLPAPYGWSLVKVIVEFAGDEGEVITAFVAYNVNPDERFRWAR